MGRICEVQRLQQTETELLVASVFTINLKSILLRRLADPEV